MTKEQRDLILSVTRRIYYYYGCVFPDNYIEMIEYLRESEHPTEINSLKLAIDIHNIYNNDNMDDSEFFDWHEL